MGRPREHDDTTAEQLLDAAEALLSARGMDAVTVRAVAEAVDVSVRAVYSTFGGKDALIGALVGRAFTRLADRVDGLPESDDPRADLVRVATDGFRPFAVERPHLYRLSFEQVRLTVRRPPWLEQGERSRRVLVRWVRRALGTDDAARVADVTAQFHAICQGLAACEINGVWRAMGVDDPPRMWREAVEAYATHVSATK